MRRAAGHTAVGRRLPQQTHGTDIALSLPVNARLIPVHDVGPDATEQSYARARHARYFEPGVVYHVISRTHGNLYLLRPDTEGELRSIVTGILAEAKSNWPRVRNYGTSILSNHLHALLAVVDGDPRNIADYIAFIKRELTRRWRAQVDWTGSIWGGYRAAAVITPESQLAAFRYVLAQGVKENLVADPQQWPGFHCAQSLSSGMPATGYWFDGTGYGKAVHADHARVCPKGVSRADYTHERTFAFDPLPALEDLRPQEYRSEVCDVLDCIGKQRAVEWDGRPALGADVVCSMDPRASSPVPTPPWFRERRRFIVWDDLRAPDVKSYLRRYWTHQAHFREASDAWCREEQPGCAAFPNSCFVPGLRPRPIAQMEQSTA